MLRLLICFLFVGCAIPNSYKLDCGDIASSAARTYEHQVGQPAVICVGRVSPKSKGLHVQAMGTYGEWLTVRNRTLYTNVTKELGEKLIYWCEPRIEFDRNHGH